MTTTFHIRLKGIVTVRSQYSPISLSVCLSPRPSTRSSPLWTTPSLSQQKKSSKQKEEDKTRNYSSYLTCSSPYSLNNDDGKRQNKKEQTNKQSPTRLSVCLSVYYQASSFAASSPSSSSSEAGSIPLLKKLETKGGREGESERMWVATEWRRVLLRWSDDAWWRRTLDALCGAESAMTAVSRAPACCVCKCAGPPWLGPSSVFVFIFWQFCVIKKNKMAMIHGKQWVFLVFLGGEIRYFWRNSKRRRFRDFSTFFEIQIIKFCHTLDFGIS